MSHCTRCQGLLVVEFDMDLGESLRCALCGWRPQPAVPTIAVDRPAASIYLRDSDDRLRRGAVDRQAVLEVLRTCAAAAGSPPSTAAFESYCRKARLPWLARHLKWVPRLGRRISWPEVIREAGLEPTPEQVNRSRSHLRPVARGLAMAAMAWLVCVSAPAFGARLMWDAPTMMTDGADLPSPITQYRVYRCETIWNTGFPLYANEFCLDAFWIATVPAPTQEFDLAGQPVPSAWVVTTGLGGPVGGLVVTGTATAPFEATSLNDSTKAWPVNVFASPRYVVTLTEGAGAGQSATIMANTATGLTPSPAWTTTPDITTAYEISVIAMESEFSNIARYESSQLQYISKGRKHKPTSRGLIRGFFP